MALTVLTWNLFHGRDFPPDPELFTWRSRICRISERNETHVQVNRELAAEFATVLAGAEWDVALLQECPPRWSQALARACAAESHLVLTARNSFAFLRSTLARLNPDLIASNEGGSNLTLVRRSTGRIAERRELELYRGCWPDAERRTLAFTGIEIPGRGTICVANLHASAGQARRALAERQVELAAERTSEWAGDSRLVLGGDLNLRPRDTDIYGHLERRYGLRGAGEPGSLDHLLARGIDPLAPAATWPPERRELEADGARLRLSDHAPVECTFR